MSDMLFLKLMALHDGSGIPAFMMAPIVLDILARPVGRTSCFDGLNQSRRQNNEMIINAARPVHTPYRSC